MPVEPPPRPSPVQAASFALLAVIVVFLLLALFSPGAIAAEWEEEPTAALTAIGPGSPREGSADIWQFGGWALTGLANGQDGSLTQDALRLLAISDTFAAAPAGAGPGWFGIGPTAIRLHSVTLGDRTVLDGTSYHQLGSSDSWAGNLRWNTTRAEGDPAIGLTYWPNFVYTDEAGTKHKPAQLQGFWGEGGTLIVSTNGHWPLPSSSTRNYWIVWDLTYEPEGDSRGTLGLRHFTAETGQSFIEGGVGNLGPHWFLFAGAGITF